MIVYGRRRLASLEDLQKLNRTRRRLSSFSPKATRRWGTLSTAGAMCHLAICYEMVLDPRAHITERTGWWQQSIFRYAALHVPVRWVPGYPTLPELVEGAPGVRPGVFSEDHARLLTAYDRFSTSTEVAGRKHPIFGPLTHWEWMRWGYLHADHHLRQFGL